MTLFTAQTQTLNSIAVSVRLQFCWDYAAARRRQTSPLEDSIEVMEFVFRYVPPWVSIPPALFAFFGGSTWLNQSLNPPGLEKLGSMLGGLVALCVLIGGLGAYRHRQRQAAFLRLNITLEWVNGLTWQEFENLVGEIFRSRGYSVEDVGSIEPTLKTPPRTGSQHNQRAVLDRSNGSLWRLATAEA